MYFEFNCFYFSQDYHNNAWYFTAVAAYARIKYPSPRALIHKYSKITSHTEMHSVIDNNLPSIPTGFVKIIDPFHSDYGKYGRVNKRGRISNHGGEITVEVELLTDKRTIQIKTSQIRQTDTVQEATQVNVASLIRGGS